MAYDKPFKTFDEQLDILHDRGLIIEDRTSSKNILLTYSYYDLINGYKDIFMPNDKFVGYVNLETLAIFSDIDKSVQSILLRYALMTESKFKTALAYILAKNIGVHEDDYLHQSHYKAKIHNNLSFSQIKAEINKSLDLTKAKQPTRHYLKHHNHVPPWILLKNVSLGSAINLFKALGTKNKQEVANLLLPSQDISLSDKIELIINMIEGIRSFRNRIAHNLDFIKCRTVYNLPFEGLYQLLPPGAIKKHKGSIQKKEKDQLRGLYGIILSMYVLLNNCMPCRRMLSEFISVFTVPNDFLDLINEYKKVTSLPNDFNDRCKVLIKSICPKQKTRHKN